MSLTHFTVSQIRTAATCPRILYFDARQSRGQATPKVSRLWKIGPGEETACGSIFHHAVEKFHQRGKHDPQIHKLIESAADPERLGAELSRDVFYCDVNRTGLVQASAIAQQNFLQTLRSYTRELADIIVYARQQGIPANKIVDRMFGDKRRRVDVTFAVGDEAAGENEEVHVTGALDYVFSDWRSDRYRIIDYKLTPAQDQANDLFQVALYALMHDIQHQTHPNAAVLYLYPQRIMSELTWEQVIDQRHKVYNLLASMASWVRFEKNAGGLKPPGDLSACATCPYTKVCERELGPKSEGSRVDNWTPERLLATTDRVVAIRPVEEDAPAASPEPPLDTMTPEMVIGRIPGTGGIVALDSQVIPTHISVVGAAGSGKTWLAKIIAEEAILQSVPVVAVDPQGDLVQFLRQRDLSELPSDAQAAARRFWDLVEPRVYTPGTSHGIRLALSPIRLLSDQELASIEDAARRGEVREEMLAGLAANLVAMAKVGGEVDCQQTFLLEALRQLCRESVQEISIERIAAAVLAPDGVGILDAESIIRKSEREKLGRKLNNIIRGPTANLYRDGVPLDLEQMTTPTAPGKVPLNVIYLNALHDDDQKHFFVANLAAEIYRWMITRTSTASSANLLFYIDEARDFIPAGASKPPAKLPLLRLLTQGRKFGVGCLVCTQSPRSLDYNVFGNCSTKIIGRLESSQDVERVKEWFAKAGEVTPSWLAGRRGADKGTFVGRWPGISEEVSDTPFLTRILYSHHEGAWSPDRLEREMS